MFRLIKRKSPAAFIHVPKTGGTYVVQHESKDSPVIDGLLDLGHTTFYRKNKYPPHFPPKFGYNQDLSIKHKNQIHAEMIFANVRNPFDWLVSYWFHAGGRNPKYHDPTHYDFEIAQKDFPDFVEIIANRESLDYWPSKRLIFFSLFEYNGPSIPHWINHTATLDKNLKKMADKYNLNYTKKSKQRVGRKDRSYQEYYNSKTRKLVEETWKRELILFGYNFDGHNSKSATIKNQVASEMNQNLIYLWEEDKLILNNKVMK